jgi:hypothetical protein
VGVSEAQGQQVRRICRHPQVEAAHGIFGQAETAHEGEELMPVLLVLQSAFSVTGVAVEALVGLSCLIQCLEG